VVEAKGEAAEAIALTELEKFDISLLSKHETLLQNYVDELFEADGLPAIQSLIAWKNKLISEHLSETKEHYIEVAKAKARESRWEAVSVNPSPVTDGNNVQGEGQAHVDENKDYDQIFSEVEIEFNSAEKQAEI